MKAATFNPSPAPGRGKGRFNGQGEGPEITVNPQPLTANNPISFIVETATKAARKVAFTREEAEDFAGEAILKALLITTRSGDIPVPSPSSNAYLTSIIRNDICDSVRKAKVRRLRAANIDQAKAIAIVQPDPGHKLEADRILDSLPPPSAHVLHLAIEHDWDYNEAAQAIGVAHIAFKARVRKAIRIARQKLGGFAVPAISPNPSNPERRAA